MSSSSTTTTMALARAFTKRNKRPEVPTRPTREGSVRFPTGTIKREKISLPTELLSTTNVLAFNAPDIHPKSASSSSSSLRSGADSDFSHISTSFITSPITSPETSSIEATPPTSPDMNHLTPFFESASKRSATGVNGFRSASGESVDAPAIPQRAVTHSKVAHQAVARQRSVSRMSPPPTVLAHANVVRDSTDIFSGNIDATHPFSKELAQVNEIAEEFAAGAVLDDDEQYLMNKGLKKFGVEDYVMEIEGLYGGVYGDHLGPMPSAWI